MSVQPSVSWLTGNLHVFLMHILEHTHTHATHTENWHYFPLFRGLGIIWTLCHPLLTSMSSFSSLKGYFFFPFSYDALTNKHMDNDKVHRCETQTCAMQYPCFGSYGHHGRLFTIINMTANRNKTLFFFFNVRHLSLTGHYIYNH